ncbi:hypothetical protein STANM309S_03568 [Streptomyces tanashiensis]
MGDEMENGVEKLLAAVRAGESGEVPALLEPLDAAAREAALVRLKALRAEVRAGKWATPPDAPDRIRGALYVAGAGCLPTAAAAASWLGARDLQIRAEDKPLALAALGDRDPEWAADLAGRLAGRRAVAEHSYALLHGLIVRSGYAVPPAPTVTSPGGPGTSPTTGSWSGSGRTRRRRCSWRTRSGWRRHRSR